MKKIIFIGLLLVAWACEKNDVFEYDQQKSSIHFAYSTEEMSVDYDIAFRKNANNEYYGDSLRTDTLRLVLNVMGQQSETDRLYQLKAIPVKGQDTSMLAEVKFMNPYRFRAGLWRDTAEIILIRAPQHGEYTVGITFDMTQSEDFEKGAAEHSIFTIHVIDRYPKPDAWDYCIDYVGEYSEEKYAFYVTVMKEEFPAYWWMMDESYPRYLNEKLDEYNTAHPEAPKDFTFPRL